MIAVGTHLDVNRRQRAGVSLRCIVAMAAVVGSLGQVGCGADVERVAVAVQRSGDPCEATVQESVRPMNAYMVELRAFSPDVEEAARTEDACVACNAGKREDCALLQRQCLCDSARPTSASALSEALSGLRFSELQGDVAHCLRVIALQDDAVDEAAPTSCECRDGWVSRVRWPPPNEALITRACASHSTPTVLASETLTLELTCLDDHHGGSSSADGPPPPTDPDPYVQCLSEEIF